MGGLIGTATAEKDGLQSKKFACKVINYKDIYGKIYKISSPCFLYFAHYYEQRLVLITIGESNSYEIIHKSSRTYRTEIKLLTDGNSVAIEGIGNNVGGSTNVILIPLGTEIKLEEISGDGYSSMS